LRFLIPLQRSLAALALSGAASLRTIPLRRFHPGVGPRVLFKATCRPDFLRRPCGFPLERIPCDEARVADVLGPEAFQSNPSLARRVSPMGSVASVSAGRRSVAPTATSSIARAGEIGETDLAGSVSCKACATPRQPAHRPPAIHLMSSRSRATHTTRAPSLRLRRPQRVIRHIAPSSRGVPLPVSSIAQPGRTTQVFPSRFRRRPTALLGFFRALRRFTPAAGWTHHACFRMMRAAEATRCRFAPRVGISAGPGPRAVRAFSSAPISFRRGDRSPVG